MADSTIESIGIALVPALGIGAAVGIVVGCHGAVKGNACHMYAFEKHWQSVRGHCNKAASSHGLGTLLVSYSNRSV